MPLEQGRQGADEVVLVDPTKPSYRMGGGPPRDVGERGTNARKHADRARDAGPVSAKKCELTSTQHFTGELCLLALQRLVISSDFLGLRSHKSILRIFPWLKWHGCLLTGDAPHFS